MKLLITLIWVGELACSCHSRHVEVRGQVAGFLFPPCGSGIKLELLAWASALPAELPEVFPLNFCCLWYQPEGGAWALGLFVFSKRSTKRR